MKDSIYLVFTKAGGVARMYKQKKPELKRHEHAVEVELEVDDSFFRSAVPRVKLKMGPEELIRPEVGVVVAKRESEDGKPGETVVKDPGQHVEELADAVLAGEVVSGLPEWAYHATVKRLEEMPVFQHGRVQLVHGLQKVPGERTATLVIHRGDVDPKEALAEQADDDEEQGGGGAE